MSWKVINHILGSAVIDEEFAQKLLSEPLVALRERGFQLTLQERYVFEHSAACNLQELSQYLLRELRSDSPD